MIREMFAYAKEHEPCIIFMDEIDAIGGRRFSEGTSADREIQRTLMEVSLSSSSSWLLFPYTHLSIPCCSLPRLLLRSSTFSTQYIRPLPTLANLVLNKNHATQC